MDHALIIMPCHPLRKGWEQAFQKMASCQDDVLLDEDQITTWDETEWQW